MSVNIVPRLDIYGRSQARDLRYPTRDNIHRYQCNNPILLYSYKYLND